MTCSFLSSVCRSQLLKNATIQISVSSCSNRQSAWEDSQRKLKSMTTVRALQCCLLGLRLGHMLIWTFLLEIDKDTEYAFSFSLLSFF